MTTENSRADALTDYAGKVNRLIGGLWIERAADGRGEIERLLIEVRKATSAHLSASPVEQPAQLTAQDALAAIETFEIVGDNNDSREPNTDDRFILTEFIAHAFGGYPVKQPAAAPSDDARECLMDVVIHHANIVSGFTARRLLALDEQNSNAAAYWNHEIVVAHRMKEQAERALAAMAQPAAAPADERAASDDDEHLSIALAMVDPCPFCGSESVDPKGWLGNDGCCGPACDDCGATAESVERWNRRAACVPAPADERATWGNARDSLAVAMSGFADRLGSRDFNAAIGVLDAITEPGLPLAWLRTARAASANETGAEGATFQSRVRPWLLACFGAQIAADRAERNHRFFEEAGELVQAGGMTREEAHALVDYTWSRPVGEPTQEVGGVMVTLAALCLANGLDMHAAGETELARINVPETVAKIRAKQAAKPKHSPLPEAPRSPAMAAAAPAAELALREALGRARGSLYAIAKTYDDDELRARALEAYDEAFNVPAPPRDASANAPGAEGLDGLAHELWAAAQIPPRNGEGIEDAVRRITAILSRLTAISPSAEGQAPRADGPGSQADSGGDSAGK
ncbi:hypothetical protein [Burkholderia ubonensis]|uniref:hypothetical protein n=1 Tax=Burkholderia ubonensis TaxID=101571 RepID=UPI0007C6B381|nr:hypothetical protein [Burkholderia ubonensis]